MKVKELIEMLSNCDGEMEVLAYEIDDFYKPIENIETVKKIAEIGYDGDYFECLSIDFENDDLECLEEDDILYIALS